MDRVPCSRLCPGRACAVLVLDLQAKLYGPRSARIGDSAEVTGEPSRASRITGSCGSTGRNERLLQTGTENLVGNRENVPVEHIEEGGAEIDCSLLAKEARFLPYCEVFIFPPERTRKR